MRLAVFLLAAVMAGTSWAGETVPAKFAVPLPPAGSAEERGYRFVTEKAYLPPDFDQALFDELWKRWPEPLKSLAEKASPDERRRMAFERYGLSARPGDEAKPLQYVVNDGRWVMNCFACHGGNVLGQTVPGAPNSHFALETLTEDVRATKLALERPLARMDVGSLFMPLGGNNGTTNAVMFGVVLLGYRDADLNIFPNRLPPPLTNHDMDAPAWWHYKRKSHIYIDGFAQRGHRGLMQFMLVKDNGPQKFREWETDFKDVEAYLQWVTPPKYPFAIDQPLAARGAKVFAQSCAKCHGTYGDGGKYPEKMVPIAEIGTDRVRLDALTPKNRAHYGASWFAEFGRHDTHAEPTGYVAPPLDGLWASAPYFHNGSVPTLWHVLHPAERPKAWRRTSPDGYDSERVGLPIETADAPPDSIRKAAERRTWFDTRGFGKSAAGHDFPDELNEEEKGAVLEYLKTL